MSDIHGESVESLDAMADSIIRTVQKSTGFTYPDIDEAKQQAWLGICGAAKSYKEGSGASFRTLASCHAKFRLFDLISYYRKSLQNIAPDELATKPEKEQDYSESLQFAPHVLRVASILIDDWHAEPERIASVTGVPIVSVRMILSILRDRA